MKPRRRGSQIDTLNKKYDDLTKHGTSTTVTSAKGEDMAKKELKLASAAGQSSFHPVGGSGVAGTADPPSVSFNPTSSLLSFSSGRVDFSGAGVIDPLLGSSLTVNSTVSIGLQSNGTIHLGDSELTIQKNGQLLLHGYLIEAAYMSSSLPGFAGMIQASLDIPPDSTWTGINNNIGSPVLATLNGYIGSGDHLPLFWFYTNQPLFDANGHPITLSSEGVIKFGIPVPEPSTATLLVVGLVLLCWITWHRRCTANPQLGPWGPEKSLIYSSRTVTSD
ncbi:MAG TPA: PEP-CTERM sorting domain-containing protein [Acidobacteriaceae bacterium]|nr:PEP-CTERM sorting domain-containing protein [Acidobacteriaceae bacterium]